MRVLSDREITDICDDAASCATDRAWAAGIIDGEGCIALTSSKLSHRLRLWVGNTQRTMPEKMQEIFGIGNISVTHTTTNAPFYVWTVNGIEAASVLADVRDYLVVKIPEADIAIRFADTIVGPGQVTDEIRRERNEMVTALNSFGNRRAVS